MNKAFLSGVAAVAALGISTASAVELDGKKGIGAAAGIGGVQGLAFNYGTGNLAIEGLLGVNMLMPKEGDGMNTILFGAGAHFMALRADKAAFSVGGRLNLAMGKAGTEDVTQFGLDIPTRVYWFADEHVSLHWESGVNIKLSTDKGEVLPVGAGPEGKAIGLFSVINQVGATFWW